MTKCHVVIARYKEDISWVWKLSLPVFIYNKSEEGTGLDNEYSVTSLPNVGHEGHTFVHHILQYYYNLPEKLVLLQGDPFDHCAGVLDILSEIDEKNVLTPLSQNWKYESLLMEYNWEGFTPLLREMAAELELQPNSTIRYGAGAQYIVQKSDVLKRPKEYYESLLNRLAREQHPLEGWVLERLWPYVFGYANKVNKVLCSVLVDNNVVTFDTKSLSLQNIEIEVGRLGSKAEFKQYVENRAQDFVFYTNKSSVPETGEYYIELIQLYEKAKFSRPTESDVLIYDERTGIFMTHRYILLQHMSAFQNGQPDYEKLQARGVPVLIVSG